MSIHKTRFKEVFLENAVPGIQGTYPNNSFFLDSAGEPRGVSWNLNSIKIPESVAEMPESTAGWISLEGGFETLGRLGSREILVPLSGVLEVFTCEPSSPGFTIETDTSQLKAHELPYGPEIVLGTPEGAFTYICFFLKDAADRQSVDDLLAT